MMDLAIHICIPLLVYFKSTKTNKITKRRIVKEQCADAYKLNTKLCK